MRKLSLCLTFFAFFAHAIGVAAQSTADTVYHLHGSVVNGATGRPIGRALVVSQDRRLATMTNAEGQFTLDVSVPASQAQSQAQPSVAATKGIMFANGRSQLITAGGLALTAQRPGFLQSRRGTPVALDSAAETHGIVLRLMPSASIRGQVTASGTEGYRGIRVELLHHTAQDGRLVWQMTSVRPVGADGSFSMTNLQPGEYTVVTSEWAPGAFNVTSMSPVSEQYPPDFLGDTRTLAGATKLQLRYGQSSQVNLHLRPVPYYAVTVPIQGVAANTGANVRVSTDTGVQLFQLGWNSRSSAVEGALPDGDYQLAVSAFRPERGYAQVPIHVAGAPVQHAPVGLTPAETIPVLVRDERTQPATNSGANAALSLNGNAALQMRNPGFFLFMRPADDASGGGMMQMTASGPVLQNMQPGRYYVQGNVMGRGYIAAMTCDGKDLLLQPLVVNDSGHTAPVEITLRDDVGTVSGTVDMGDSGSLGARVWIVPTDGSGHVVFAYANSSVAFQAGNVPPGSYRVFATVGDAPELPFRDSEAMRPFSGKGTAVTVTAGQESQVQTRLLDVDSNGNEP